MLAARRITTTDELGDEIADFQRAGLMAKPKRRFARPELDATERRDIRARAVKVLLAAGFHTDEIAVAISQTRRAVQYKARTLRELAMEGGRV